MEKFTKRVGQWKLIPTGLHGATAAYNTFGASVLSYLGQLEAPPPEALDAEEAALRQAVPGPGTN